MNLLQAVQEPDELIRLVNSIDSTPKAIVASMILIVAGVIISVFINGFFKYMRGK